MARREIPPDPSGEISKYVKAVVDEFQSDCTLTLNVLQRLIDELPTIRLVADTSSADFGLEYAARILVAAFGHLGWKHAVKFLQATPIPLLERRIMVCDYLADKGDESNIALFSREEMALVIRSFGSFLKSEEEHLIETGLPATRFRECWWLEKRLAKLYPDRRTREDLPNDEPLLDGKKAPAYDWIRTIPTTGPWPSKTICCPRGRADWNRGLDKSRARRMVGLRKEVLELKLKVLTEAETCLYSHNCDLFWDRCIKALRDAVTYDQATFLMKVDHVCRNYPRNKRATSPSTLALMGYGFPFHTGGFTDVVELIGYVCKECSIATIHKTREALEPLITRNEENEPGLWTSISWPYFAFVDTEDQQVLDNAIDVFLDCDSQEQDFWSTFDSRLKQAIETFDVEVHFHRRVRPAIAKEFKFQLETFANHCQSHHILYGSLPELPLRSAGKTQRRTPEDVATFFSSPDLKWENVSIVFISDESIKITAAGKTKVFGFSELGFEDGRTRKPTTRWTFLRKLANLGGQLAWDTPKIDSRTRGIATKAMSDLKRQLTAITGIMDSPFHPYDAKEGYRTRFLLRDESPESGPQQLDCE